jgi:arsenite methyltransferase
MTGGESFDHAEALGMERLYQTPDVIEQRRRTVELLGLRQGERVLDVGAGPAMLVADMAEVVGPSGQVTGLEISQSMLAVARRRCASLAAAEWITLARGNASEMPFADGSFDVATSSQVYEYVPQVDGGWRSCTACCGPAAGRWSSTPTGRR